jgi:hypothetical protein
MQPKFRRIIKFIAAGWMFGTALCGVLLFHGAEREGFMFLCGFALFKFPDAFRRSLVKIHIGRGSHLKPNSNEDYAIGGRLPS